MSEYIITIEDDYWEYAHERFTHFFGCPIEEIVRCRDCKHFTGNEITCGAMVLGYDCSLLSAVVEPDGFCAWGERRDA